MCENIADGGAAQVVDLRSDFVARPTPAMVEAMLRAARQPCGFGLHEDTIVADLENRAAEVIGKDDALFVPTCTMANQIALHIHCSASGGQDSTQAPTGWGPVGRHGSLSYDRYVTSSQGVSSRTCPSCRDVSAASSTPEVNSVRSTG